MPKVIQVIPPSEDSGVVVVLDDGRTGECRRTGFEVTFQLFGAGNNVTHQQGIDRAVKDALKKPIPE